MSPASCADGIHNSRIPEIESALEDIRLIHVPDRRIAVFNVERDEEKRSLIRIETDNAPAARAVQDLLDRTPAWKQNVEIIPLPHADIGDNTRALVRVSVANMRRTPQHQAELIDQAIMGTTLKVLKRQRGWYYIQTPWNYLGWVTSGSLTILSEDELASTWTNANLAYINAIDTQIFNGSSSNSGMVTDITLGGTVKRLGQTGSYTKVALPDGREGYVSSRYLTDLPQIDNTTSPSPSDIVATAQRFHGLPYLWGGNSGKAFDCSGFTNTVFRHNGFMLPRDANMQVEMGQEVAYDDTFESLKEGDLIFFGYNNGRIFHVGISLGGARYIHASSYVMINSLNPNDADFSEYHRTRLANVRRI